MEILLDEQESKGRAHAIWNGVQVGEMTFNIATPRLWIVDHTEVAQEARGEGVGRKMLDLIVDTARTRSVKILPLCPYAKSVFDKDESLSDVRNGR